MTQETKAPEVTIDMQDIVNARQIIKAAIERGAFQAEEISGVAGVFDKFNAFVQQAEAIATAQSEAEAEVESDKE